VRPVHGQALLSQAVRPGDTLIRVNGQSVRSWSDAIQRIVQSKDSVTIETNRGAVTIPLNQAGAPTPEEVAFAIDYELPPVIGDLMPGEPASKAGFQVGDSIVAINGTPVRTWSEMVALVANSAGNPTRFEIVRKGSRFTLTVTPRPMDTTHPVTGVRAQVGKIGAYPMDVTEREPVSFGEAIKLGARTTWFMGTSIIGTVRDLVTRKVSVDQLGGPIAITRASVQAARSGVESLFYLIALLSVNVAILNLLPIPILDGGQILINLLESARGSPFSLKTREYILRGGLLVILLLFVLVMFNDTRAWLR
jgi:regulator of sigma E protease